MSRSGCGDRPGDLSEIAGDFIRPARLNRVPLVGVVVCLAPTIIAHATGIRPILTGTVTPPIVQQSRPLRSMPSNPSPSASVEIVELRRTTPSTKARPSSGESANLWFLRSCHHRATGRRAGHYGGHSINAMKDVEIEDFLYQWPEAHVDRSQLLRAIVRCHGAANSASGLTINFLRGLPRAGLVMSEADRMRGDGGGSRFRGADDRRRTGPSRA
jgi:hypothetical protein